MKTRLIFIIIGALLNCIISSLAQEKHTIAVISIQAYEGVSQGEAEILTDRLRNELVNTGTFSVMERQEMQEILKEQGFQLSGCTSTECMVQAGRILGVREIMGGSVGKFGDIYTVSLRIIDVETGQIITSQTDDVSKDKSRLLTVSMNKLANKFVMTYTIKTQHSINNEIDSLNNAIVLIEIDTSEVKIVEDSELFLIEKDGMVLLPGGEFLMGSIDGENDEKPIHKVSLSPFWIDKYEVTVEEYEDYILENSFLTLPIQPKWNYSNHPIVRVKYKDALDFAKAVDKRLPTEAEWEYVAKGGMNTEYPWYNGIPSDYVNLKGTAGNDKWKCTSPVGSFQANRLGLYDISGNVWEWCVDKYDSHFYNDSPFENPKNGNGYNRVIRGGSYKSEEHDLRCSNRYYYHYYLFNYLVLRHLSQIGFRCVRDVTPEEIEYYIINNPNYGKLKQ